MSTDLLALFLSTTSALITTGLFLYGIYKLIRSGYAHKIIAKTARLLTAPFSQLQMRRAEQNPIISKRESHYFELQGTFNPGAVYDGTFVHIFYRAVGGDGVSRIAYARSKDGIHFHDEEKTLFFEYVRSHNPLRETFMRNLTRHIHPGLSLSGGSFSGIEDPRAVIINDTVYISFNIFEEWRLRVACITISLSDLQAKRFDRISRPVILSRGNREKNWSFFSEKIDGQFALLHGIIDEDENRVHIEYAPEIEVFGTRDFKTIDPQTVPHRPIAWHARMRSAGPPPIKTSRGWLVFYHAHHAHEPARYKVGAMLLDLHNPERVIVRAKEPVLSPDAPYENEGKPGIVYTSGAVVKDDTLFLYYGGGDQVTCVATTPFTPFVDRLYHSKDATL